MKVYDQSVVTSEEFNKYCEKQKERDSELRAEMKIVIQRCNTLERENNILYERNIELQNENQRLQELAASTNSSVDLPVPAQVADEIQLLSIKHAELFSEAYSNTLSTSFDPNIVKKKNILDQIWDALMYVTNSTCMKSICAVITRVLKSMEGFFHTTSSLVTSDYQHTVKLSTAYFQELLLILQSVNYDTATRTGTNFK